MTTIKSRGLSAGSLYKIIYLGLSLPVFLLGLACGISSYFGHQTVTLNNQYVYGVKGLITGIVIGIVVPIILSAFMWVFMYISIWVWTRVRFISLTVKD